MTSGSALTKLLHPAIAAAIAAASRCRRAVGPPTTTSSSNTTSPSCSHLTARRRNHHRQPSIADVGQSGNLLVITGKPFGVTNIISLDADRNVTWTSVCWWSATRARWSTCTAASIAESGTPHLSATRHHHRRRPSIFDAIRDASQNRESSAGAEAQERAAGSVASTGPPARPSARAREPLNPHPSAADRPRLALLQIYQHATGRARLHPLGTGLA